MISTDNMFNIAKGPGVSMLSGGQRFQCCQGARGFNVVRVPGISMLSGGQGPNSLQQENLLNELEKVVHNCSFPEFLTFFSI